MAQPGYSAPRNPSYPSNRSGGIGEGFLFGIPVKDLGWFASLLIGMATGFASFFAATFFGIVFIMVDNTALHGKLDYAWSYSRIGLPIGLLVATVALAYLGYLWVRRKIKGA